MILKREDIPLEEIFVALFLLIVIEALSPYIEGSHTESCDPYFGSKPSYLCEGCSDEAYRNIATRCHGIKELFVMGGESVSFKPSNFTFFNVSCTPFDEGLFWVNITSDKPVKVIIHSRTFEGENITYGCINMQNVTITALQDSRVVVEVREITPRIYNTRAPDFYRIYEALPNLHDDQECR